VTVKGVAELDVSADLALWPILLTATGDDLAALQEQMSKNVGQVMDFLGRHGIDPAQAELQGFRVTDTFAERYGQERRPNRYVLNQTVMVRSDDPEVIRTASQQVGELVRAGVVLASGQGWGPSGPTFLFTGLNDIKPRMIADATQKAREAAEQFAHDSQSEVAGIRRANQGVFVILPRDPAPGVQEQDQLHKTVRVVSTVEYFLRD